MKKIILLLAVFSLLLIGINCDSDDENANNKDEPVLVTADCLYGTWKQTETDGDTGSSKTTTITFNDDKTVSKTRDEDGAHFSYEEGTWSLDANLLEIIITKSGDSQTSVDDATASANDLDEADYRKSTSTAACNSSSFSDDAWLGGDSATLVGNWKSEPSRDYRKKDGNWEISKEKTGSLSIIKDSTATYSGKETKYFDESTNTWLSTPAVTEENYPFANWTYDFANDNLKVCMDEAKTQCMDMSVIVIEDYIGLGGYTKQ